MIRAMLAVAALLLLAGPFRKRFISSWRVMLPLAIGGILGSIIAGKFMPYAPSWMRIAGPVLGSLMMCGAVRELLYAVLGPPKGRS